LNESTGNSRTLNAADQGIDCGALLDRLGICPVIYIYMDWLWQLGACLRGQAGDARE
jgi:hypothetical protein